MSGNHSFWLPISGYQWLLQSLTRTFNMLHSAHRWAVGNCAPFIILRIFRLQTDHYASQEHWQVRHRYLHFDSHCPYWLSAPHLAWQDPIRVAPCLSWSTIPRVFKCKDHVMMQSQGILWCVQLTWRKYWREESREKRRRKDRRVEVEQKWVISVLGKQKKIADSLHATLTTQSHAAMLMRTGYISFTNTHTHTHTHKTL